MSNISNANLEKIVSLLHPVIYVRGYAMTEQERDETAADPYCGFNTGSTVYRASINKDKKAKKFIFESPVVKFMSDFGYANAHEDGLDIMDPAWQKKEIPYRSIIIYRYYDEGSTLFGEGKASPIPYYARNLSKLISKVREYAIKPKGDFKCYLVAHSMGGLICRALLQNPELDEYQVKKYVDKVFTYATPHNGIEMAGINIPSWLSKNDMNNFSRKEMARYLALEYDDEYIRFKQKDEERVDLLRNFPPEKFFCMVGTNRSDYQVAAGLSRTFAGHGSDGLVKVDNAVLYGPNMIPCPRAYTYRSHSGYFGIVNSEEAFQNLTRFLFGNIRIDISFEIDAVTLPKSLQEVPDEVDALYLFEVKANPKKMRGYLTRRVIEEDSVAVRTHKEIVAQNKRYVYLSTAYLADWAKIQDSINPHDDALTYAVTLGIAVQEYIKEGLIFDGHIEGVKLFSDTLNVSITPGMKMEFHWGQDATEIDSQLFSDSEQSDLHAGKTVLKTVPIPTSPKKAPSITGKLRFDVTYWNLEMSSDT